MKTIVTFIFLVMIQSSGIRQEKTTGLKYLIRYDLLDSAKPGLLILLHGIGSNEKDLFSFADKLPGNYLVISVRAPLSVGNDGYAWFNIDQSSGQRIVNAKQAEESRNLLIKFIEQLKGELVFDEKK